MNHRTPLPARLALGAALALGGCKDQKPAATAPVADKVMEAVELDIRGLPGMPAAPRFRGERVYSQAIPLRTAVCGQVSPFADDGVIFVPFVTVVTAIATPGEALRYTFDHRVGSSTTEASRVYAAIVTYCYDKGGPASGPFPSVSPTPPLPNVPDPAVAPAAAAKPASPAASASGTVTVKQAATLHADPHGASVRTVQRGVTMKVFSNAPGGWLQVGATAPEGWLHESMVDRH